MRVLIGAVALVALGPAIATAERHTVAPGETLAHVAQRYGCTTKALLAANRLHTTVVPLGTVVTIPACRRMRTPAAPSGDDRATRALAVIDDRSGDQPRPGKSQSIGRPWDGRLVNGRQMPRGEGYELRRPTKAYGADHVVEHLRNVIAGVRALHPEVPTLAIGDLSDREGGPLDRHRSHQSGLDVDVGLYYTQGRDRDIDLAATWALIVGFARTIDLETGVEVILLDTGIQARLYQWARSRGTPEDQLAALLQYPRGEDAHAGVVRHWPNHKDHLHVRFKPAP